MEQKDLLELLYTARNRFTSLHVIWDYRYRQDLMQAAREKWSAQFSPGSVSMLTSHQSAASEPAKESTIHWLLWWQKPDCWRDEQHGQGTSLRILCGERWYLYSSTGRRLTTNQQPLDAWSAVQVHHQKRETLHFPTLQEVINDFPIVDPSFLLATHELEILGESLYLGRPVVRVRAKFRPGRNLPWEPLFWSMIDDLELLVDRERGVLLRYTAQFNRETFADASVKEIFFDELIPEEVFSFIPPPGTSVDVVS